MPKSITNRERVGRALDLLKDGLVPFVEREMKARYLEKWLDQVRGSDRQEMYRLNEEGRPRLEVALLLKVISDQWNLVFQKFFGRAERRARSYLNELRDVRNDWAHQEVFSAEDAFRAVDTAERFLRAVSAPEADEIRELKLELLGELRTAIHVSPSTELALVGRLRDFGFSEKQEQEICEVIRAVEQMGGVNVHLQEKGEEEDKGDVLVFGDFDDGPNGTRKNGFFGQWNGKEYRWVVYLETMEGD